jgi:hypothetical protein
VSDLEVGDRVTPRHISSDTSGMPFWNRAFSGFGVVVAIKPQYSADVTVRWDLKELRNDVFSYPKRYLQKIPNGVQTFMECL